MEGTVIAPSLLLLDWNAEIALIFASGMVCLKYMRRNEA